MTAPHAPILLTASETHVSAPEPIDALGVALAGRRIVARATLAGILAAVGITLLLPRTYTASGSFLPQGRKTAASLANLAAQLGVGMPSIADAGQSPAFFADLVKSRAVLNPVADVTYPTTGGAKRTIADVEDITDSRGPAWLHAKVLRWMNENIIVNSSPRTGVVSVAVTSRDPVLSLQLTSSLLNGVSRFNFETRQTQAMSERKFTERRVAEARAELHTAEETLAEFDRANRVGTAPFLAQQRARLEREITLRAQVYTTLSQAFEQAKIEEVRDTPVLTIIEVPEQPVQPNSRGALVKLFLGATLGALVGAAVAYSRRQRYALGAENRKALWAAFQHDLTRPWHLIVGSSDGDHIDVRRRAG